MHPLPNSSSNPLGSTFQIHLEPDPSSPPLPTPPFPVDLTTTTSYFFPVSTLTRPESEELSKPSYVRSHHFFQPKCSCWSQLLLHTPTWWGLHRCSDLTAPSLFCSSHQDCGCPSRYTARCPREGPSPWTCQLWATHTACSLNSLRHSLALDLRPSAYHVTMEPSTPTPASHHSPPPSSALSDICFYLNCKPSLERKCHENQSCAMLTALSSGPGTGCHSGARESINCCGMNKSAWRSLYPKFHWKSEYTDTTATLSLY